MKRNKLVLSSLGILMSLLIFSSTLVFAEEGEVGGLDTAPAEVAGLTEQPEAQNEVAPDEDSTPVAEDVADLPKQAEYVGEADAPQGLEQAAGEQAEVAAADQGEFFENGNWYYRNTDGTLLTGWGILPDGRNVYYNENGAMVLGQEAQIGNEWWYFGNDGNRSLGLTELPDGRTVYYDYTQGLLLGDERQVNDEWFYFAPTNGNRTYGMFELTNGSVCYYEQLEDGTSNKVFAQERLVDGRWYYFNDGDGNRHNGWGILPDGRNVFYDGDNGMITGQESKIGNEWWYFGGNGERAIGLTDLPDGRLVCYDYMRGILLGEDYNWDDEWYYFSLQNGNRTHGMQELINGAVCYYELMPDGTIQKVFSEERNVDGKWHYFESETGYRANGMTSLPDGRTVFYDGDNGMVLGQRVVDDVLIVTDPTNGNMINLDQEGRIMRGIDVSSYQGTIDWAAVKASGIDFAVIRMMTWSNGDYAIDPMFDYNIRQARANGIMVGAYLFSYAYDEARAEREINFFLNHPVIQQHRAEGIIYELPVYIDYENEHSQYILSQGTSYETRTNALRQGMNMLRGAGYKSGFYADKSWASNVFNGVQLQNEGYDFWLAYWPNSGVNTTPDSKGNWNPSPAVWQYTSSGSVPGINGRVDMNYGYKI